MIPENICRHVACQATVRENTAEFIWASAHDFTSAHGLFRNEFRKCKFLQPDR